MPESKNKKIMIISLVSVLVLALLGGGYYLYSTDKLPSFDFLSSTQMGDEGADVMVLVDKLNSVKIDTSIFSNVQLSTLKDYSVELTPELSGRSNPFSPIGVDN